MKNVEDVSKLKSDLQRFQHDPVTQTAIKFYHMRLSIFPILFKTKTPAVPWKRCQTELATKDEMAKWFLAKEALSKKKNIGFATGRLSGVVVVDADSIEAVGRIEAELPATPLKVKTRKGFHYYYRYPQKLSEIKNLQDGILLGSHADVDVRGDGGYIVCPGSVHPDDPNFVYSEVTPFEDVNVDEVPFYEPHWVVSAAKAKFNGPEESNFSANDLDVGSVESPNSSIELAASYLENVSPAIQGKSGDLTTFRVACDLVRGFNLNDEEAMALLLGKFNPRCQPKWTELALKTKVESARKSGTGEFGYLLKKQFADPSPIHIGETWVPSIPKEMVPAPLRSFVEDNFERNQFKRECLTVALLICFAGICGRKFLVQPKASDPAWKEYIRLWGGIVDRPSVTKTGIVNLGMSFVHELSKTLDDENKERRAERKTFLSDYESEKKHISAERLTAIKAADQSSREALNRRQAQLELENLENEKRCYERILWTSEGTIQKLKKDLEHNAQGLLLYRDELRGLFEQLERRDAGSEKQFFLESWNGTNQARNRIKSEEDSSFSPLLSIVGAITSEVTRKLVSEYQEAGDDGFLARFSMLVFPSVQIAPTWIDRSPNNEAHESVKRIFQTVFDSTAVSFEQNQLSDLEIRLKFDSAGSRIFSDWFIRHKTSLLEKTNRGLLESHLGKYTSLVPVLAGVFHLLDWADGKVGTLPTTIRSHNIVLAICWSDYLKLSAERMYSAASNRAANGALELKRRIECGDVFDGMSIKRIYDAHWSQLDSPESTKKAVAYLEEKNWLRVEKVTSQGRPTSIVKLNPKLKLGEHTTESQRAGDAVFQSPLIQEAENLRIAEVEEPSIMTL